MEWEGAAFLWVIHSGRPTSACGCVSFPKISYPNATVPGSVLCWAPAAYSVTGSSQTPQRQTPRHRGNGVGAGGEVSGKLRDLALSRKELGFSKMLEHHCDLCPCEASHILTHLERAQIISASACYILSLVGNTCLKENEAHDLKGLIKKAPEKTVRPTRRRGFLGQKVLHTQTVPVQHFMALPLKMIPAAGVLTAQCFRFSYQTWLSF